MNESIEDYRLTAPAAAEMARRQIAEEQVRQVLAAPEQSAPVREGRVVYQSRIEVGDPPAPYLPRVFVDIELSPPVVVTVYRTSKIAKYWRADE